MSVLVFRLGQDFWSRVVVDHGRVSGRNASREVKNMEVRE